MCLRRALVTGGSGFIGANLVRRLVHDGHETHLLLRPEHQAWRLRGITDELRMHQVDLSDFDAVRRIFALVRPHWVFHLAAYGAYPTQSGIRRMTVTNLLGTAALFDASAEAGVEVFIQTGSSSEYGYKDHPTVEGEALEPNSDYAITKAAATHYCQLGARKLDFNAVTVRLYSIYGPYEDPNRLIPRLILHGLHGSLPPLASPETARDFVYVDDAVEAMLRVAAAGSIPRGAVYNICSGVQSSLKDVVEIAASLMRVGSEPVWASMSGRSWDTNQWVGSPDRTEREIGWRASVSLEAGIRATIEWFQTHPELLSLYSARVFPPELAGR